MSENKKIKQGCFVLIALAVVLIAFAVITDSGNDTDTPKTNAAEPALAYLSTTVIPAVAWHYVDGNNCYIGFRQWKPSDIKLICNAAALKGNEATGFGFHVWACDAEKYRSYSPQIMAESGYGYEVTYRHGQMD